MSDIGLDDTVFSPECDLSSSSELPMGPITTTTALPQPCPVADQVRCPGTDICIDKERVNIFIRIFFSLYDIMMLF